MVVNTLRGRLFDAYLSTVYVFLFHQWLMREPFEPFGFAVFQYCGDITIFGSIFSNVCLLSFSYFTASYIVLSIYTYSFHSIFYGSICILTSFCEQFRHSNIIIFIIYLREKCVKEKNNKLTLSTKIGS